MERIVIEIEPKLKREFEIAITLDKGKTKKDAIAQLIREYVSKHKRKG